MPPIATGASIRSRVVPATAWVIAASRPTSRLNKVDLPALGGPASTTRMPSRSRSAEGRRSAASISAAQCAQVVVPGLGKAFVHIALVGEIEHGLDRGSEAKQRVGPALDLAAEAPPASSIAERRWVSVSAASRSARPSASARSIRPLAKARRVNSPGLGRPQPRRAAKGPQHGRDDRPAAMEVELHHVLAGGAVRARERRARARSRADRRRRGAATSIARRGSSSDRRQRGEGGNRVGTADPDNGDRRRRLAGRQGKDGVAFEHSFLVIPAKSGDSKTAAGQSHCLSDKPY